MKDERPRYIRSRENKKKSMGDDDHGLAKRTHGMSLAWQ
ncbi:hypothetical protein BS78_04G091600 [Paspalum vaginatum]|nr:hypothetical protein BS78_04G091600 [Paspalum vaginatum]